jgi:tRNA nucleotidyltransferase (CCA-adding enzyme)
LEIWFPVELELLAGLTQGKQHFGDVLQHTLAVVQNVRSNNLALRMAALLHDTGKYDTKVEEPDGRLHFHGHEKVSAEIAKKLLTDLGYDDEFIHTVAFLVHNHMKFQQFGNDIENLTDKSLNRVIRNSGDNLFDLLYLIDADNKSHAPEYCRPDQVHNIMLRIQKSMLNPKIK